MKLIVVSIIVRCPPEWDDALMQDVTGKLESTVENHLENVILTTLLNVHPDLTVSVE